MDTPRHQDARGSTRARGASRDSQAPGASDAPGEPHAWAFRLYVAGMSPHSAQAIRTIKSICEERLPGGHDLGVFDLYQDPGLASEGGVLATPTLDKLGPPPAVRLVGLPSDPVVVARALGIDVEGAR